MPNIFRGDLRSHSLAEVLGKIHHRKVPGRIVISRGNITRHLYIHEGQIIFASSNRQEDRLGEFLARNNVITQQQLDESSAELIKRNGMVRLGKILLEMKLFDIETLGYHIKEQIKNIFIGSFEWTCGDITFQPGAFKTDEVIKLNFNTSLAILEGLTMQSNSVLAMRRFENGETCLRQRAVLQKHFSETLPQEYHRVFNAVQPQHTIAQITDMFPDYPKPYIQNMLYAFFCLQLIVPTEIPSSPE